MAEMLCGTPLLRNGSRFNTPFSFCVVMPATGHKVCGLHGGGLHDLPEICAEIHVAKI